MKPRAYSYLRMSTDIQLRGDSRRRQLEASRAYAEDEGLELAHGGELEDIGVSAFKGANIKEGALGRFVAAAEAGAIQKGSYLLVENLDRLSRQKVKDSLTLFLRIVGAGITIVTLYDKRVYREDELDVQDLVMSILSMARAHDESRMKSERVGSAWQNKRDKASAGRPMTKRAPAWLTLREDRERYEIISGRAAVVRSMYEDAASGIGMYSIARRSRCGGHFGIGIVGEFHPRPFHWRRPLQHHAHKKLKRSSSKQTQVKRPVAYAPVSMLIRFGRTSGVLTGVWPCTISFSKSWLCSRNSSRIHIKSAEL